MRTPAARAIARGEAKGALAIASITPEIAVLSTQFPPGFPKDPADRFIAATARAHGLTLVTRDEAMQKSPLIRTVW